MRSLLLAILLAAQVSAFCPTTRLSTSRTLQWASTDSAQQTEASESGASSDKEEGKLDSKRTKRVAVLVCPAQFCVPGDYEDFFLDLERHWEQTADEQRILGTHRVAPLPRTEWIKVARQLPTRAFLEAKLPVYTTLKWYFEAIESALLEIFAEEGDDVNICIVGHSIGGWVARAYLGGLGQSSTAVHRMALERCSSFITLGTPHTSPDDAMVDQTRGLLREIAETQSCSPQVLADQGIDITCVCSNGLGGKFLTTNVEDFIAAGSYMPLLGRVDSSVKGDGIVPLDLAFMDEPARRVVVETCSLTKERIRHAHVVPTPWNLIDGYAPSIRLPNSFPSYVSEGVIPQWSEYIR